MKHWIAIGLACMAFSAQAQLDKLLQGVASELQKNLPKDANMNPQAPPNQANPDNRQPPAAERKMSKGERAAAKRENVPAPAEAPATSSVAPAPDTGRFPFNGQNFSIDVRNELKKQLNPTEIPSDDQLRAIAPLHQKELVGTAFNFQNPSCYDIYYTYAESRGELAAFIAWDLAEIKKRTFPTMAEVKAFGKDEMQKRSSLKSIGCFTVEALATILDDCNASVVALHGKQAFAKFFDKSFRHALNERDVILEQKSDEGVKLVKEKAAPAKKREEILVEQCRRKNAKAYDFYSAAFGLVEARDSLPSMRKAYDIARTETTRVALRMYENGVEAQWNRYRQMGGTAKTIAEVKVPPNPCN